MTPTPTTGLIGALVFLGGALTGALVGAALTARLAREEPRGGYNGMRNETQRRPPPPATVERENPSGGLRDLEEAPVEGEGGGENGGGGGEEEIRNMMILIVMLATRVVRTFMTIFKVGSESKIPILLELLLSFGIILYLCLESLGF